jgi:hypothetical protein
MVWFLLDTGSPRTYLNSKELFNYRSGLRVFFDDAIVEHFAHFLTNPGDQPSQPYRRIKLTNGTLLDRQQHSATLHTEINLIGFDTFKKARMEICVVDPERPVRWQWNSQFEQKSASSASSSYSSLFPSSAASN